MIEEQPTEASSVLRRAAEVERRAREAVSINEPLLFLVWGAVYLLGYGALYFNVRWADGSPPVVGAVLFGAMGAFGFIFTFTEIRKRFRGLRGETYETVGRMIRLWGVLVVAWIVLLTLAITQYRGRENAMAEIGAVSGATATLLVGVMYLLIASNFPVWQTGLGLALVSVGAAGLVIPPEHSPLFVAVGAGGSFFLAAANSAARRRLDRIDLGTRGHA
ncbi:MULTISPECIES: hypothetical protein [Auritidibacter]|uniref:Uncharacterized protein n=1 Tax=Auritidibacter ignavus TaxID=678932 RepID=A0AAJ6AME6_9MICC|nr:MULTISPECIES: hypothetical protein [Auritidibacter]NIH72514.1 glucan phosphoethanolaminetransferase (alkaline phosphatase superfamily) [Auritidibacter ignavus]WGH83204.1 hypothetical protein QDX20_07935 [Auritidibacter ignavus]WGH90320.1 hypothetical protein QDX23_09375 [Auritidibacter ignavus]WGH92666.1 hypothetical protein QDX21_10220 [Auritidibacter ignavus]WHS28955.1 hypothetical protein QM395_04290 [Auritidibacter ignavus]